MKSDLEIAKEAKIYNIKKVAKKINLKDEDLELYGENKAKISIKEKNKMKIDKNKDGNLILVTAINPTPSGEGKTTVTIGLGDALNSLGKKTILALREPSLGPVFGVKGGATGGGYSQVIPMEDINLHFTGDFYAIASANNLMCAAVDNHIFQGNELNIDKDRILISRTLDMNDRALRNITLNDDKNNNARNEKFEITAASEVMAAFCMASDIFDLKKRLGEIIIGYTKDNKMIFAKDLKVNGAMTALLKDAIKPNLVQTLEHNPVIIHGGPFANIAHGTNSIIATKLALKLSDYVVTEAGFGSDLGAEKYYDIICNEAGIKPKATVLVATIRALKYNGGIPKEELKNENVDALKKGICNLTKHIENLKKFNIPFCVALNRFDTDKESEIEIVKNECERHGIKMIETFAYSKGSKGTINLANEVLKLTKIDSTLKPIYNDNDDIKEKIEKVASEIYGAEKITYSDIALEKINEINEMSNSKFKKMKICIAKTQMSLSDDPKKLGRPENFEFTVRDIKISGGANFIVVYAGNILTMPGLSKNAAYMNIDIDDNGEIIGIF